VLRAWAGDRAAYRRSCRQILDRFGTTTDPMIAERVAKSCLLLPTGGPEADEALLLAERALARAGDSWLAPFVHLVLGLAEYRVGHPEAAIRWLDRSLAHPDARRWLGLRASDHFARAMAFARLGRLDEARAALALGHGESPLPTLVGRAFDDGWHDVAICHMLLREAELACLDAAFPADPFRR
jgi:hypothetical protein